MSALEPGWVVAVDGGGSKIAIAAMRTDGLDEHSNRLPESLDQARQWHFPGTGSAHPSSWLTAASNLQRGLWTVTSELLQSGLPIHYLLLSLAGAGRPEDRARVLELGDFAGAEGLGEVCGGKINLNLRKAESSN